MERREKTEFILEQMRFLIMVAKEKDKEKGVEGKKDAVVGGDADWVKVRVGGRKVSEKFLEEKENEVRTWFHISEFPIFNSFHAGPETQVLRPHDPI